MTFDSCIFKMWPDGTDFPGFPTLPLSVVNELCKKSDFHMAVDLFPVQTEAGRSPDPMGPPAALSEGPPQQPAQGAGQCAQLGLGQHGSRPLPAPPLAASAPRHCAGAARLQVRAAP